MSYAVPVGVLEALFAVVVAAVELVAVEVLLEERFEQLALMFLRDFDEERG